MTEREPLADWEQELLDGQIPQRRPRSQRRRRASAPEECPVRWIAPDSANEEVQKATGVVFWHTDEGEEGSIGWMVTIKVMEGDGSSGTVLYEDTQRNSCAHPLHDWLYVWDRGIYAPDLPSQMQDKWSLYQAGWEVRSYRREASMVPALMVFNMRQHIHGGYGCGAKRNCPAWAVEDEEGREHLVYDTENDREELDMLAEQK